jgi:hypothetical protein
MAVRSCSLERVLKTAAGKQEKKEKRRETEKVASGLKRDTGRQ